MTQTASEQRPLIAFVVVCLLFLVLGWGRWERGVGPKADFWNSAASSRHYVGTGPFASCTGPGVDLRLLPGSAVPRHGSGGGLWSPQE